MFLISLLQIHPRPQVQKAISLDQRGEVGTRLRQHSRLIHSHRLQGRFNPNCCLVVFRLKKICEIYSRVLGTEEALHVSLDTDFSTDSHSCRGTASLVKLFMCPLVSVSRCTTRRRTGVKRSTPGAATRHISPQESLPSLAGKSHTHMYTGVHTVSWRSISLNWTNILVRSENSVFSKCLHCLVKTFISRFAHFHVFRIRVSLLSLCH